MSIKSKISLAILILGAFAAAAYMTKPAAKPVQNEMVGEPTSSQESFEGRATCLPHKDKTGPQTDECALGLKTDAGTFYALDGSLLEPGALVTLNESERVRVSGLTVPIEAISSDMWKKYDIIGIMRVEAVAKLR